MKASIPGSSAMPGKIEFYSILCGVFLYKKYAPSGHEYVPWTERLPDANGFDAYVKKTYYENYYGSMFGIQPENPNGRLNTLISHATMKALADNPLSCVLPDEQPIHFSIHYFDRFIFSDGLGIYCFKIQFAEETHISYPLISDLLQKIRNPESEVICGSEKIKLTSLIHRYLQPGLQLPQHWHQYLAQLKHYTVIDDSSIESLDKEKDETLFELAHCMPIGTIRSNSNHSPTPEYYDKVLTSSVFIYKNWKAIALLDSFSRISASYPDTFKSWELDYFHIYVHCLYAKYQLYYFNSQSTTAADKQTVRLKEKFFEFVNEYSASSISYKFLPNLLYEKMKSSLELQKEIENTEKKMSRIREDPKPNSIRSDLNEVEESVSRNISSSIIQGYAYDIFVSYRRNDNKYDGWVSEFVKNLKRELVATLKEPVNIYFDENPADGLLETHDVDDSLKDKLKSLIFIPIVSQTYCDTKSFAWKNEFMVFKNLSFKDDFGSKVKLPTGNVASRILPMRIHELDESDRAIIENEIGPLRAIDFIFKASGVNRPLTPHDKREDNADRTFYRDQINKVANAVKEILTGLKKFAQV